MTFHSYTLKSVEELAKKSAAHIQIYRNLKTTELDDSVLC